MKGPPAPRNSQIEGGSRDRAGTVPVRTPMKQLTVVSGPDRGTIVPLRELPLRIGRDAKNGVVLRDALVSRFQATVEVQADGTLEISDQGSTNGTEVNGLRISKTKLRHGDLVQMGGTTLVFSEESDAARGSSPGSGVGRQTMIGGPD